MAKKRDLVEAASPSENQNLHVVPQEKESRIKRQNKVLQDNEERWRFALEGGEDGVWDWNAVTNEVFYSRRWKEMLGYRIDEIGDSLFEWKSRVHPDDIARVMEEIERHFGGETPAYVSEHRVRCKDGSYKWILDRGKVVSWTREGVPLRVVGTHNDISNQKQTESALKEGRQKLMAIFDQSPIAIGFFDGEGRIEMANKAYLKMFSASRVGEVKVSDLFKDLPVVAKERFALIEGRAAKVEFDLDTGTKEDSAVVGKAGEYMRRLVAFISTLVIDSKTVGYTAQIVDVTRRRLEEQEIIQERSKLLSVFENIGQIICVSDPSTHRILYANNSAKEVFGNDMFDKSCYDALFGRQTPCSFCPDLAALKAANVYELESYRSNEDKFFRLEFHPIVWIDGRMVLLSIATDITLQKRTEHSLKRSEANFSTFFNTVEDCLFVLDGEGKIITVNDTVVRRLGYTPEALVGRSFGVVHPADRAEDTTKTMQDILGGRASRCFIPLVAKTGKLIPVETTVSRGTWNDQDAHFVVSKDITELQLSEEKFSRTFQSNATPMALTSYEDGRFVDVNEAFLRATGYGYEEVIGKTSLDLSLFADPYDRDAIRMTVRNEGSARNFEIGVRVKSGEIRHGLFSAEPFHIQDALYLITSINDVTEIKRLEQELRSHKVELERKVAERTAELENNRKELESRGRTLEEVNIALKVLLKQIGEDKQDLERRFASNIKKLIFPYLEKVKNGRLDTRQSACLNIIEMNLNEIISPFLQSLGQFNLTPREAQVATLIKDGKTSKEIAQIIGMAPSAVDTYRNKIRTKLGLSNKKINLQTYLQSIK
jgi:PAS domain S-box-containing protein